MSRFGWAYVNGLVTGSATAAGPTNSVQYNSGSGVFSGSSNFTFNPSTNVLTVVGTISASNYLGVSGSGGTTSPAGLNKYLQYNSGSAFGASSNLIFDYTTNELILTGNVRVVGQVSASTSLLTSGTISAGSNITSFGIISSSNGIQTNTSIQSVGNITSTSGSISSSAGIYTNGMIVAQGSISSSNSLLTSGSVFASAMSASGLIQATSLKGDGLNIIGVQASNVDGAGDDWTIQFKSGDTGRLTGSSGLTFSGSALTASIGKFDTIIVNRTSTSSSISLTSTQHIIAVNTSGAVGNVTLSLPNASTLPSGKHYVIKDEGGKADAKNIIVSCSVFGQTIDGNSSVIATSPYAALNVYCDGTSKYFIY